MLTLVTSTLKPEATMSSKTLVPTDQSTCHNPRENLIGEPRENLRSN